MKTENEILEKISELQNIQNDRSKPMEERDNTFEAIRQLFWVLQEP